MSETDNQPQSEPALEELNVDEALFKTTLTTKYRKRKPYEPLNPNLIRSFMPGNIPVVFVKIGDRVAEGEKLLILEAMKMKNQIIAPFPGIVKEVNVKQGDVVPKNHILIEIEPL